MKFEWDENKRLTNIRKHRIDFLDVEKRTFLNIQLSKTNS